MAYEGMIAETTSIQGNNGEWISAYTARPLGATWRFTLQADSHLDSNTDPKVYTNTMANIVADSSDFLIDLGDTFMSDKFQDYHDAAPMIYLNDQVDLFGVSRKLEGFHGKVKGKAKVKKQGIRNRIMMECTACGKKHERTISGRMKKKAETSR